MNLSAREEHLAELMDDPDCDPVLLQRTLRRFDIVNRAVAGWGAVYRARLRPALAAAGDGTARILDIGCGGGDVLRRLVRYARRDGLVVEGLGIDPDPRAIAAAQLEPESGVHYRRTDSTALVAGGECFDIVVSNHLLHHLDRPGLDRLIADSEALAGLMCVHSDIARSRAAYALFGIAAAPLAPGSFIRVDGLRSIRRSYTAPELAARLPPGWGVERIPPFRLLAMRTFAGAAP